jgi:DHA2 family multidrug resistance protein
MALMPPFLQRLLGYPVLTTGYKTAGLGTMLSMFIVGRLVNRSTRGCCCSLVC